MRLPLRLLPFVGLLLGLQVTPASAAPWLWDQNANRIDDRIEAVNTNGLAAAHLNNDLNAKLKLFVFPDVTPLAYGVYVGFDHMPTDADVAAIQGTGAQILWRPQYIQYVRARASFAQIQALTGLTGITRVEGWQPMYGFNDNATRTLRARDAAGGVGAGMFPSVWKDLNVTGKGVVVGILDSGVNDGPEALYPGHESLVGKFVGGGNFSNPDAALNTPVDGSENPADHGAAASEYHGSHVAGTAIGSGGPTGILAGAQPGRFAGMAPEARLVDCKVITDAGIGGGAAEALEWCIAHRNTVWSTSEPGVTYRGVQVINMSIGGTTASDGTDADCAAVNAAVKAGIVICIATGNDGNTAYMPSPGAADLDVAVGALQDANTLQHGDDIVADYSNEGPRLSDGDADHLDEMKPSVLGSGSDIVSVLGDPTTDGREYQNINGTSMATPCIAGICALIRQANPDLTPAEVRDVLQNTASHRTDHGKQAAEASDPFGVDPNYHPSWGWGEVDAYAAVKEALNRATTQVVVEGTNSVTNVGGHLEVATRWVTQREIGVNHFVVYRANEVAGTAGAFAAVSPDVAPVGQAVIERAANRTSYSWTDSDLSLVPGQPYWYQVRWVDSQNVLHSEPAFRVATDVPPIRARVSWAITHNALDNDVYARFGSGTDYLHPAFVRPCGGSGAADSSVVVVPVGFGTMTRWYFHTDLTDADLAAGYLPPSSANPWFLAVREQGFVNTEGLVDGFSVTTYNAGGLPVHTYSAPNPITPTVEQQTVVLWIPLDPATQVNHAPVFTPVGNKSVGQGLELNFQVHATDPDGQALTYAAIGLPVGATFVAGTQTFDWRPSFTQSGNFTVKFRATDNFLLGAQSDTETVVITVIPRTAGSNTPPVLAFIPDRSTHAEMPLAFTVSATDNEGGTLTYSATLLPAGATFDAPSRTFHWTPPAGSQGDYGVTFQVMDPQGATDMRTANITVVPGSSTPPPAPCTPDSTTISGTIGVDVQGTLMVSNLHSFNVPAGTQQIFGALNWTGGPAIDLDLYLVDPSGNLVASGATATSDPEHALYVTPEPGTYQWKVVAFDNPNPNEAYTITSVRCISAIAGAGDRPELGMVLAMPPNEPNPFSRSSVIRFALPATGAVKLRIFDVSGRLIRTLVDGSLETGWHQRVWDGRDDGGGDVTSGIYFSRLETPGGTVGRKMIRVR